MKKLVFLLTLIMLLGGGCKYFKKSTAKSTITADTMSTSEPTDSSAYYNDAAGSVNQPVEPVESTSKGVSGKYYMIVGCFTISTNADNYAEKMRGMGYEAQIIPGNSNFQMVAARSYSSYRESVKEIDKFRTDVTPNAWVYLQK